MFIYEIVFKAACVIFACYLFFCVNIKWNAIDHSKQHEKVVIINYNMFYSAIGCFTYSDILKYVHMRGEMNPNRPKLVWDFISIILTEMKFQTGMRFSCEQNLTETKWISADSLDITFNDHVRFETHCWYGFHNGHFDRNEISFLVIKHHVNTTRNEIPIHIHQNIGSFWDPAALKLHVNRTCFHAGVLLENWS